MDVELYHDPSKRLTATQQQKEALDLYMQHHTVNQISQNLGIPFPTVRDWTYLGRNGMRPFAEIRNEIEKEHLKEIAKAKQPVLHNIMDSSLCVIKENLNKLKAVKADLSVEELKKISDIAGNMDKILRLDLGQATENVAVATLDMAETVQEVKNVLVELDDFGVFGE